MQGQMVVVVDAVMNKDKDRVEGLRGFGPARRGAVQRSSKQPSQAAVAGTSSARDKSVKASLGANTTKHFWSCSMRPAAERLKRLTCRLVFCGSAHHCSDSINHDVDLYFRILAIATTTQAITWNCVGPNTTETHIFIFPDRLGGSGSRVISKLAHTK